MFQDFYGEHPDLYARSRLAWIEGKIAAGLGHLDEAEAAFLAIRQHFLEEGNGYDAATVSLDCLGLGTFTRALPIIVLCS